LPQRGRACSNNFVVLLLIQRKLIIAFLAGVLACAGLEL